MYPNSPHNVHYNELCLPVLEFIKIENEARASYVYGVK